MIKWIRILSIIFIWQTYTFAQKGMFSLGVRSTFSSFQTSDLGLGSGGQFRIQFSDRVNSDWFADYIVVNESSVVKSEYLHIGWSVLYYPFKNEDLKFRPYVLAGHCFDYNKKSMITIPSEFRDRWGSAIQGGLGVHWNLTPKFDVTLMYQFMYHLTPEIFYITNGNSVNFIDESDTHTALETHSFATLSLNYKIGKLWAR